MTLRHVKWVTLIIACVVGFVLVTGSAMADPGKSKHGRGHKHAHHAQVYHDGHDVIIISSQDRALIRNYMVQDYHSHCPPGLAKKHNGCMPPGQAKKYRVGGVLADGIYVPVSGDLLTILSPVPRGYQYVQVDQDVLLISEASKKVIDAVTLLSAVGH